MQYTFLLGLMEKAWEYGTQIEVKWMQAVVDVERVRVKSLEVELHVEQSQAKGNDTRMWAK